MVKYTPVSGIYIILNTKDGKVYIGQAQSIRRRWGDHKSDLNRGKHRNTHLQRAWNKYGVTAFKFQILEYCPVEQLDEREKHHIAIYKGRGLAYNTSNGGQGTSGVIPNAETRQKLSDARKGEKNHNFGKTFSAEHRQKLSDSHKNPSPEIRQKMINSHKGKIPPNKGKPMSEGQRLKMAEIWKLRPHPMLGKHCSEETRQKISKAKTNPDNETRRKISIALSGSNNPMFGKCFTAEHRQKISDAGKRRPPISEETREKMRKASIAREAKKRSNQPT